MKVVILAGGLGTRLREATEIKPKPMVEIGERPILWHIMKIYAAYGFNEFVIALGYKNEVIKNYFLNYHYLNHNLVVSLQDGNVVVQNGNCEDWVIHLLDTGIDTQTGGRLKMASDYIGDEPFMFTYGDGVATIDIEKLLVFHQKHGKLATVTAVRPPSRFGGIVFDGDLVAQFEEKPQIGAGWVNGGFFVLEPGAIDYVNGLSTIWERDPMEQLAADKQLTAFRHEGFWQCMDTLRDVRLLEKLWNEDGAPWKVWK
jgi:glucose-1-phosphate cytidylyltransferase